MTTIAYEINFDGLVGMTHTYAGLALGNVPSMEHAGEKSSPKQAALQGLNKMKLLYSLGIRQAVLPPHERPFLPALKRIGFTGAKEHVLNESSRVMPWFIPYVGSAAPMWTANAGTVTPSIDSSDSHVHITAANLTTYFHRAIEAETTSRILKAIFPNPVFFTHHPPLFDGGGIFKDEGSANQIRFCKNHQSPGVSLFVFGEKIQPSPDEMEIKPNRFPARQSKEGSEAIARLHLHYPRHTIFAQQHPEAIDLGVFHNDLISFGNQNVYILHEKSFFLQVETLALLKKAVVDVCDTELNIIEIKEEELPLEEAVNTYFFNSQLVTLADGSMALIAPIQCQKSENIMKVIKRITEDKNNPINVVHYVDLTQSMQNGGGPACLRLRVVLNEVELAEINPAVLYSERLHDRLVEHIHKFYPNELSLKDLGSRALYEKNCDALNDLTKILNLGKVYPFQL